MTSTLLTLRRTSCDAYETIKANGLLSRMRWQVYSQLYRHGPQTARELGDALASPGMTMTSYHKRCSELERLGVARTIGKRKCGITGFVSMVWDVTDELPDPSKLKRRSWKASAEEYRAELVKLLNYFDANDCVREASYLRRRLEDLDE